MLPVHIEEYPDPWTAIGREKELKEWNQARKRAVNEAENLARLDLSAEW